MSVHFDNPLHIATMWVPQVTPTRATVISTLLGLLVAAIVIGAVGALFTSVCLERSKPLVHGIGFGLALLALVFAVPAMRHHVWGASTVYGSEAYPVRADATAAAQAASHPRGSWRPSAAATAAPRSTAKPVWQSADLQKLSDAAQEQEKLRPVFPDSQAVVDTTQMSAEDIAKSGTSYVTADGEKQRCVVELKNVRTNNIGQPLTADIDQVRCAASSS